MTTERKKLPDERPSVTKKLTIAYSGDGAEQLVEHLQAKLARVTEVVSGKNQLGEAEARCLRELLAEPPPKPPKELLKIYVQVGLYPDTGKPGEIFLKADRMGTLMSGMLDALSMSISVGLQSGVPLRWFTSKMRNMQFEPAGATNDPKIRRASSVVDALARWLDDRFPDEEVR